MASITTLSLIILLLLLAALAQQKLIYTFGLMRHGAIYPKNGLYDGNQTKKDWGLLTPIGQRMTYNLGTYLQSDYIIKAQLTPTTFNPNKVEFYSTSYQRTQISSLAFIYGLYPLQQGWRLPQGIEDNYLQPPFTFGSLKKELQLPFALNKGFQPLPVRPLDSILDNCPYFDQLLSQRLKQIAEHLNTFSSQQLSFLQRMARIFNLTDYSLIVMCDLYETLYSDIYLGRTLPTQYSEIDHQNLKYIYEYYNTLVFDGNFARVLMTPTIRMLRNRLSGAVNGKNLTMSFTFGHQSNIHPILTLMHLTSTKCLTQKWRNQTVTEPNCVTPPQYAANLIVQLHYQGSMQVKVRYNGEYIYLCGRQQFCPYDEFVTRLQTLQTNYQQQCRITSQLIFISQ